MDRRILKHFSLLPVSLVAIYAGTAGVLGSTAMLPQLILAAALLPPLVWLSCRDLRNFEIPDAATILVALVSGIYLFATDTEVPELNLVAAFCVTGILWALGEVYFRHTGSEGLGIGDAKLFGAGALLHGPWQLPELFLLPAIGGITCHMVARMARPNTPKGIPFGPFIAYATFVLIFLEPFFL